MPMSPLFEAVNISCERDERLLFRALSFQLNGGEVLQVAGHNGVGKTTLLRGLCGLNGDLNGHFSWYGQGWPECRYQFAQHTLFLGHNAGIKAVLSPRENLRWYFDLRYRVSNQDIEAALVKAGLYGYEDSPSYQLSAGQQRRIALARLYASKAKVWVLDEPFTAIDKHGVQLLERSINDFAAAGGAVMLTSHHALSEVNALQILDLERYRHD